MTNDTRRTRVRVALTVEVDIDAWALEYGTEATIAAVREDVRSYVVRDSYPANVDLYLVNEVTK